ncbi:hypothetical protein PPERSA_09104 [Pseudocohnilembus persalinus]|uniref:glycerol kinase n=1 Tax=Pseudocohnilembus persalinus TaxID=266149 RepID=A0A0V0QWV0_PSEPJ|nr:hypothetical protein PPERSA_09104 [Pseudocohnilembus persalinus]|eukprot:KRX06702.1 hypothetical protein PPERSA_09104 [Pseudocohnilembus persalinus]
MGWLEHDAEEIRDNCFKVIQQGLTNAYRNGIQKEDIKTIGLTNQRETVVAWNKHTGKPYYNSIVWNDQRTSDICSKWIDLHKGNKNVHSQINGLPINTYFSAFKIKWLLENVEGLKKEQDQGNVLYGTMDSWIVWNLTNKLHITDVSNASRTYLMNLNNLKYEQSIIKEFDINGKSLPEIRSSSEEYDKIKFEPLSGIPLGSILGDQQAASLGHGLFDIGNSKNTYGSGCFLLVNQGENIQIQPKTNLLTTVLYQLGKNAKPVYAFEGSIEAGALTLNWARDKLNLYTDFNDLQSQIDSVQDNGGVYFVPTLNGAFSPYWDPSATGTMVGMSLYTQKGHILRSILESIAYRTKDVINEVEKNGIKIDYLNVDGGVTDNKFLMHFQSDLLQKPIIKNKILDSTCMGAAFAAGLSAGIYKDLNEIKSFIEVEEEIQHNQQNREIFQQYYKNWEKAIPRALNWEK